MNTETTLATSDVRTAFCRSVGLLSICLVLLMMLVTPAVAVGPSTIRVATTSALDGNPSKSVTLACPAGKRLVGAGAAVNSAGPDVRVYQITPNAGLTGLTVRALAAVDPSWSLTGYGICTDIPLPGLERQMFISGSDSNSKSATAFCSAGKQLLGTGGLLSGAVSNVLIDDVLPHSTLDRVTVWGVEGQGGNAGIWSVTAVAICASVSPIQVSRMEGASAFDSSSPKSASATCPQGTVMFGTGAELINGSGQVKIEDITPNGSSLVMPTSNTVLAAEDADGTLTSWQVKSYAICFVLPVP